MTYGNKLYKEYLDLLKGKKKEVDIVLSECLGGYNVLFNCHKRGIFNKLGFEEEDVRWGCFYERYNVLDYGHIRIRTRDPYKFRKLIFELDKEFNKAYENIDEEIIVDDFRNYKE